jgi:UDP-glucose 4-epimerase
MKILITGGAGFIGREVVKQALKAGHSVVIYDNYSFGRNENIDEFRTNPLLKIIKGNIENHEELISAVKLSQPETIIHLAAIHFVPYCNTHPLETIRINVEGTHSVFEAAIACNVKRVLFASSGAIYASEEHALDEKNDIPAPVDIYGISKLLCEHSGKYYFDKYGIGSIAMRFFNTYGPYETNEHLIPEILKQLKRSRTVKLGNVKTKRDYIFTEDIAKAILQLAVSNNLEKHEIMNIGTGKEYSAEEIIDTMSELLGYRITIEVDGMKMRKSDKLHQIAGGAKIRSIIGWYPQYSLKDGLKILLKHENLLT